MPPNVITAGRRLLTIFAAGAYLGLILSASVDAADPFGQVSETDQTAPEITGGASQSDTGSAPLPDAPSQALARASLNRVREIFEAEYDAAKTRDAKSDLARRLADQAAAMTTTADRWTLLTEALRLATEASDANTATALIDRIPKEFRVDQGEFKLDALSKLTATASASQTDALAERIFSLAQSLFATEQSTLAAKALALASTVARRNKNNDLLEDIARFQGELKKQAKESKARAALADKLRQSPNDPEVCLEVGRYYCFKMDDWGSGLPLLARGSDVELAAMAKAELNAPRIGMSSLAVADKWWDFAAQADLADRSAIQAHAGDLYALVLDDLEGLDRVRIEKRIASLATVSRSGAAQAKRPAGLVLWLDAANGKSFAPADRGRGKHMPVTSWKDLSGSGNDATQTEPARCPVRSETAFDGSPGVSFEGQQTLLIPMPCRQQGTLVAVFAPKTVGNMRPFGCYGRENEHLGLVFRADGCIWGEALTLSAKNSFVKSNPAVYTAKSRLLVTQTWGNTLALAINGQPAGSSVPGNSSVDFSGPWGLGGAYVKSPVEYFQGAIAEVMVFNRELNAQELRRITAELSAKWRIR